MLRCQLDPPMDVSTRTSDWKRQDPDGFVHVYRNKQDLHADQMEAYRGRTTFDRGGLSEGILTLNISSAQLNDSGRFRCFIPSLGISCDMTVKVVPKDQVTGEDATTATPAEYHATKPQYQDAEKTRDLCIIGVAILVLVIAAAVVAVLVKTEKINRRRPGPETKVVLHKAELENLMNKAAEVVKNPGHEKHPQAV